MADADLTTIVQYRPIQGCPGYRVGSDGSVWTCKHKITSSGGWKLSSARLTETVVIDARAAFIAGARVSDLALQYGVSKSTISRIVRRHSWKHTK